MMGDGNMYWMQALHNLRRPAPRGPPRRRRPGHGRRLGARHPSPRASPPPPAAQASPSSPRRSSPPRAPSRPLVAFVGESPTADEEYIQRFDQSRFAEACETGFVRVLSPESTYDAVRKAFYLAKIDSRPIMLSAPMDTQQKTMDDDEEYVPSSAILPGSNRAYPNPDSCAKSRPTSSPAASNPVVLVGRGAMWSGAGDVRGEACRPRIGALIATSLHGQGTGSRKIPTTSASPAFYGSNTAMELLQEADVVIGVGASLNRYTTEQGYLYPNAQFVQIDMQPHVMMGGGTPADCYIQADARAGRRGARRGARRPFLLRHGLSHAGGPAATGQPLWRTRPNSRSRPTASIRARCASRSTRSLPADVQLVMGSGASAGFSTMLFNRPRSFVLAGPLVRLHRPDAARGDGHDRCHRQQTDAPHRRRRQHHHAPRRNRDRRALRHAAADRRCSTTRRSAANTTR